MSKWNLRNHIIGKAYDLTQGNMNAMISDLERLKAENARLREALNKIVDEFGDEHSVIRIWHSEALKGEK